MARPKRDRLLVRLERPTDQSGDTTIGPYAEVYIAQGTLWGQRSVRSGVKSPPEPILELGVNDEYGLVWTHATLATAIDYAEVRILPSA